MNKVIITRPVIGMTAMQVCAASDVTDEEILDVCNMENCTGTANGWTRVLREVSETEEDFQPFVCESYPERRHFIVCC